jgi:hypothetical protein
LSPHTHITVPVATDQVPISFFLGFLGFFFFLIGNTDHVPTDHDEIVGIMDHVDTHHVLIDHDDAVTTHARMMESMV